MRKNIQCTNSEKLVINTTGNFFPSIGIQILCHDSYRIKTGKTVFVAGFKIRGRQVSCMQISVFLLSYCLEEGQDQLILDKIREFLGQISFQERFSAP